MSTTTDRIKHSLDDGLAQLETLGDEIRLKIHLGTMDAKTQWSELEPQIEQAQALASQTAREATDAVTELVARLRKLRDTLS